MKKLLVALMLFVPLMAFAAIGPDVSTAPDGTYLKWEEGAWDFFMMHKSLITQVTGSASTTAGNPQADTCIDINVGSTYTLTSKHIPSDADVDRAFLIWLVGQDPNNLNGTTDNSVTLTFTHSADPSITLTKEVTASKQGTSATTQTGDFEYEVLNMQDSTSGNTAVFTYRVEVSDFMKEIVKMGEERGMDPGESLYGNYNVKGLDCSNHQNYLNTSGLVGGWALPFVYTSSKISAKKIYFYHGLEAYRFQAATIAVQGFELPAEAVIKMGVLAFEGDPGLASASGTNLFGGGAEPEALAISGQNAGGNFSILYNKCNPPKHVDSTGMAFEYTEIFNSISSIFGWDEEVETCIGNPDNPSDMSNPLEYAIDADVFLVDAKNPPFDSQLLKGDTMLNLKIGANQDQVYTNLLVVSVDTKTPKFDIPANPQTPDGREKNYCSCSQTPDSVCFDRPFYYTIKVQNWGENLAFDVAVQDTLPSQVDYVPGTTEIATKFNSAGNGIDWKAVEDGPNGEFPFAAARKIADVLGYCDKNTFTCDEGAWIRFVVKPKANLSKNEVIKNTAVLSSSDSELPYYSNSNIPLRLKGNPSCPALTACELPSKAECGGVAVDNENYCEKDGDCKDGKKCINNECQLDVSGDLASGSEVTFDVGVNSPDSGSSEIIIASPSEKLVLGQFFLLSEGEKGKFYNFDKAMFKLKADPDVQAANFKLYKDNNGDGKVNEGDVEIASADALKNSYIEFTITDPANRLTATGIKNHFIVIADTSTTSTSTQAGKFYMAAENGSISVTDAGDAFVKDKRIDFATYRFEPEKGFVVTKGVNIPVPSYKTFNGEHPMLQIRTKSKGMADAIKSIKITIPSNFVKLGEGIKSISLVEDVDANGEVSGNDIVLKKITAFEDTSSLTIDELSEILTYGENQEKYLLIVSEFKMSNGEKAKIKVSSVKLKSGNDPVGLPVLSNEFSYECDPSDPNACGNGGDDDGGGCAVSELPENNSMLYAAAAILAAIAAFFALRKRA